MRQPPTREWKYEIFWKALPLGVDSEVPKSSPEWPQNVFLVLMYHFTAVHPLIWDSSSVQEPVCWSEGRRDHKQFSSTWSGRRALKPEAVLKPFQYGASGWLGALISLWGWAGDGSAPHSSALVQRGGLLNDVPSYILTEWTRRTFISLLFQCFGSFVVKMREFGFWGGLAATRCSRRAGGWSVFILGIENKSHYIK